MEKKVIKTFEQELNILLDALQAADTITIKQLMELLSGKSTTLLLILLAIPFCLPIQIPGVSTPFGVLILFLGIRMIFGKDVWVPEKLLSVSIPSSALKKIVYKTLAVLRKMNRWIKPRMLWLFQIPMIDVINGTLIAVLGFLLALPLPIPFTNLVAAYSIVALALAILEDDGILLLISYVFTAGAFFYFAFLYFSINFFLK